jgi:hypothetical protein
LRLVQTAEAGRYRPVTRRRDGQTTQGFQVRRVTITIDVSTWPRVAALTLLTVSCRQADPPPPASTERASALAAMVAACAADSLRPVAAAPAGGLWIGTRTAPRTRVAALIGPVSTDGDRARITRRVETLEVVDGSDSLRLATDTASVKLALLPPFRGTRASAGAPMRSGTEPAAVYAVTPLVLLASYEPCAESAGDPRIRYLRRDQRGAVAVDVMLRRESGETKGLLP